jgi:hypothetical protein
MLVHRLLLAAMLVMGLALTGACAAGAGGAGGQAGVGAPTDQFEADFQAWNVLYKQVLVGSNSAEACADQLLRTTDDALTAWQVVLDRYYGQAPPVYAADANWARDLATVTGYLTIAREQLATGRVKQAHQALGPIRAVLLDLRRRHGVAYYGDTLFEYHNAMEKACDPVLAAPASVTASSPPDLAGRVREARAAWQRVLDFGFAPAEEEGRSKHQDLVARASAALAQLEAVVAAGDFTSIPAAAQEVKARYRALYLAFG